MNLNLIQVQENETVTTSLLIAEKFNRSHKNVISKIEALISEIEIGSILSRSDLFRKSEYSDAYNRPQPMYYINRDGFSLLVMGFTGKEALEWKLKYIEAFNAMEKKLQAPALTDNRLEIARLIIQAPESRVSSIRDLYPEYFSVRPEVCSLEYVSDLNTSYTKWIEDYGITKEWIGDFPTGDIYLNYVRYCTENRLIAMGKKLLYHTLERDFNLTRKQRANGHRYFLSA